MSEKGALLTFRPEHARGYAGYETTRDQAFTMRAKIISEAGNHIAFSRRESSQASARNFFRRLGILHEFFLASDRVKFRFR